MTLRMNINMLIQFETQSSRVKGLSFHPTRRWILASLHDGAIQLWDYHMRTLLETFQEHDGPVRGVSFHSTQPLFASGGDDYKVKLWNFKLKKCLFTLEGHLDYIRTVTFHHELPWLMSAADDQTIRIWNWQNRNCLAIMTGHNHYVMCAQFNPQEDLIVSASLDQTIRVWDFSNLRQKFYSAGGRSSDVLLGTDVAVKFLLEGHDRGVNWATFNQNSSYVVSCADDRTIRLWRILGSKAWEVETMRGHANNVSCVLFHPNLEVIISDSEDKSIKVWDLNKRSVLHTHRNEPHRFWVLAAHPTTNLLAAGSDSGLMIFKLERERVPVAKHRHSVYYIHNKSFHVYEEGRHWVICTLKSQSKKEVYLNNPSLIQVNPFAHSHTVVLVQYTSEEGMYHLCQLTKSPTNVRASVEGQSISSCFVGRDKFAILNKARELLILDFNNSVRKKVSLSFVPERIFTGTLNKVLVYADKDLHMVDITSKEVSASISTPLVKYTVWSPNNEFLALLGKETVTICNKKLELVCSSPVESNIKSGVWDPNGVFLYSTSTQVKYLVLNGDSGIVKCLEEPLYLFSIQSGVLEGLNRKGATVSMKVSDTEYLFKLALFTKRYNEVKRILEKGDLTGLSVVKYLQEKGFPEIALYFVDDEKTKFNLAIQAGVIEVALNSAYKLNDKDCWLKLGVEAQRQGNSQIVEMAYQKTRNLDKLSLLYLLTGNMTKLGKMQLIAQNRSDKLRLFHNAILRGDVEKRAEMLAEAGQVPLAYLLAKTHGLDHKLAALTASLGQTQEKLEEYLARNPSPVALSPLIPIFNEHSGGDQNWPLHSVITSQFELCKNQTDPANPYLMQAEVVKPDVPSFTDVGNIEEAAWEEDFDFEVEDASGWAQEDFDVPEVADKAEVKTSMPGLSLFQKWSKSCEVPGELVAAGSFQAAMQILTRTIGVSEFGPLKKYFLEVHMAGMVSVPLLPQLSPLDWYLTSLYSPGKPHTCYSLVSLADNLKAGYKLTTQGKFSDALEEYITVLHKSIFLSVSNEKEVAETKELIKICTEYIACMRLELTRQEELGKGNLARALELGYYMSLCKLQPGHQALTLRSAIAFAYKTKNFITCASLCKRFMELVSRAPSALPPNSQPIIDKHKKLLAYCQQNFSNDLALGVDLPEVTPDIISVLCQRTFTQVSPAVPTSRCPFCFSLYHKQHKNSICDTCRVAKIGLESLGLKIYTN